MLNLNDLQKQKTSGILQVKAKTNTQPQVRYRVFVWKNGQIVYGGSHIPNNDDFAQKLILKFKPNISHSAISFAKEKATDKRSVRALLEVLVKIRVLTWEQIETFVRDRVVLALEQILPYPNEFQLDPHAEFDLCYGEDTHGLELSGLMLEITRRQQQWKALTPVISSMEAIPKFSWHTLETIVDKTVRQHLQQVVDGRRSLVEIAEAIDKDPLQVARTYQNWAQKDWISFNNVVAIPKDQNLPTILSVDDSPVVQTTIKRALNGCYNVLLASNAIEALNVLNQKPISLLLLDVSMAGIDGLEMCRTVRSIPKFRDLPIIMLTARDGLVDKLKGQIAGTNHYLTKPFDAEKLLEIVSQYVSTGNTFNVNSQSLDLLQKSGTGGNLQHSRGREQATEGYKTELLQEFH